MTPLLAAVCIAFAPQAATSIEGDWTATELRTAKGTVELSGGITLNLAKGRFVFVQPLGEASGKVTIDTKAGRLELVGDKGTLYGSFTLKGDTLTLALWGAEADRQAAPSTEKSGVVFVFRRKGKLIDA
jgi:hypothetical protein